MRFNTLLTMADNVLKYKYVAKNTAKKYGKVVTFMPKPLFGDNGSGMHVHFVALERRQEPLRRRRLRRASARWALLRHRRHPQARALHSRLRDPDHEQLQAARARLRGPGQPRLLAPEPQRLGAHTYVLHLAQDQAHRVPVPRPELQSLPDLLRDADGRPSTASEQDRSRAAPRQGHLRSAPRGARRRSQGSRLAARGPEAPRERPRVSCSRAMSSPRT